MGVFYHEEPSNHPKKCKCFEAILKEVFSRCQTFSRQLSSASLDEEWSISDIDEEQEVIVSTVRSRIMEKQKHKPNLLTDNFSLLSTPAARELHFTQTMAPQETKEGDEESDEREFLSVKSCFSCCPSSATSMETFYSVKTNLSRCSSMNNNLEFSKNWRRSVIQEFCHCEGWPFGLCRKAMLLPPLPKSPSDSWLSSKIQRRTKDA